MMFRRYPSFPFFLLALGLILGSQSGCDIEIEEPVVAATARFQPIGPAHMGGPMQGRISLRMRITNGTGSDMALERIEIDGNLVSNFASPKVLPPGGFFIFQNCNCDESVAYIVDAPFPASVEVAAWTSSFQFPILETVPLLPHTNVGGPLDFPAKASDLLPNEAWATGSDHPSGHQVFALDMGIAGWNGSWFDGIYPGTDGTQRQHYRVYGRPVYAMASGNVCFALNDHTEMAFIGDEGPTGSPSFGGWFGGGNSLLVNTGEEIAFYAHLQPGSIPSELLTLGAPVARGQYIGKVGYSGSTSHPHIHINVEQEPAGGAPSGVPWNVNDCGSGLFRPMQFGDIQSLTADEANQLAQSAQLDPSDWTPLSNHSAPHPYSLIHPARTDAEFDPEHQDGRQYLGVMRAGNHIDLRVRAEGWNAFTAKWAELSNDDFRLKEVETFEENGARVYLGVFERGTDGHALIGRPSWELFTADWASLSGQGLRLVDIDTYHAGGNQHWVGVFRQGNDGYALYSITGWEAFTQAWGRLTASGLRLVDLDTFPVGNDRQYIGVFRQGSDGHGLLSLTGWAAFTDAWADLSQGGLRLVDVETFPVAGDRQFVGVFRQGNDGHAFFSLTTYAAFQQAVEEHNAHGLRLVDVHVEQ